MVDYFSVALTLGHDRARLQVCGELDSAVADGFSERFEEACAAEPSLLLVDLTELSFCDSSGIRALVLAAALCAKKDIEMRIVGVRPNVRRVFELTNTAELLNLSSDGNDHC
jgi:anti-sigma B factor antagonist